MSKIIPLGDRVVISSVEPKEQITSSGFIVSTKEKEGLPQSGEIIEIGPDVKNLTIGEIVIFKEFIPTKFTHEEKKYLILPEEDILAKIA